MIRTYYGVEGDIDLDKSEILYDPTIDDVAIGDLVAFAYLDESDEKKEKKLGMGKIKIRNKKKEELTIHYIVPKDENKPEGEYGFKYCEGRRRGKQVQWLETIELSTVLCRFVLNKDEQLGADAYEQMTDLLEMYTE